MNLNALKFLTWGTVAGAIVSALALAAVESRQPEPLAVAGSLPNPLPSLPTEPTAAGAGVKATGADDRAVTPPARRAQP